MPDQNSKPSLVFVWKEDGEKRYFGPPEVFNKQHVILPCFKVFDQRRDHVCISAVLYPANSSCIGNIKSSKIFICLFYLFILYLICFLVCFFSLCFVLFGSESSRLFRLGFLVCSILLFVFVWLCSVLFASSSSWDSWLCVFFFFFFNSLCSFSGSSSWWDLFGSVFFCSIQLFQLFWCLFLFHHPGACFRKQARFI